MTVIPFRNSVRANGKPSAPGKRRAGMPTYLLLAAIIAVSAFPLYWSLVASSNDDSVIGRWPPKLMPGTHLWENLRQAFTQAAYGQALLNSIIIATTVTFSVVVPASGSTANGRVDGLDPALLRYRIRVAATADTVAENNTAYAPVQILVVYLSVRRGRPRLSLLAGLTSAVVTLAFAIPLVQAFAESGAATASAIGYACGSVVAYVLFRRLAGRD